MHRSSIAADHDAGSGNDRCQLFEGRLPHQIHRRHQRQPDDIVDKMFIQKAAPHENGDYAAFKEPIRQRRVIAHRPAFVGPVRPHGQHGVGTSLRYPRLYEPLARRLLICRSNRHRKHHALHPAADGPGHIQIAFYDVSPGVGTVYRL